MTIQFQLKKFSTTVKPHPHKVLKESLCLGLMAVRILIWIQPAVFDIYGTRSILAFPQMQDLVRFKLEGSVVDFFPSKLRSESELSQYSLRLSSLQLWGLAPLMQKIQSSSSALMLTSDHPQVSIPISST